LRVVARCLAPVTWFLGKAIAFYLIVGADVPPFHATCTLSGTLVPVHGFARVQVSREKLRLHCGNTIGLDFSVVTVELRVRLWYNGVR
jgi:hypothetical protein